ncbi:MAG: SRPBCC domain-containing protein [Acidobacteriota bacterium]|nr:SRPBCC domain-containing protein [Acidobacteriota bacterium]
MQDLPYRLDRTVTIKARPETVFRFFTESAMWAKWWGAGSTIDARPGGKVYIRHGNGVESLGEVVEVRAPEQIVFTYGFAGGKPIPPGSSLVTIRLEAVAAGTRLSLIHEFAEEAARDLHIQGWRFQLSLFANAVANDVYGEVTKAVDAWFAAWTVPDDGARRQLLESIVTPEIHFADRHSLLDGMADLMAHTRASQIYRPGITMKRSGPVRQCQGTAICDWIAVDGEGKEQVTGTNVFVFAVDGRIASAAGFANQE